MPKLKIYSPDGCRDFMEPVDNTGSRFEYGGRIDYLDENGEPPDVLEIVRILKDLDTRFPLEFMGDYPVFVLPGTLRLYNPKMGGWDRAYNGRGYNTHFIIGTPVPDETDPDPYPLDSTVTHEIFHIFTYAYLDAEYEDHNYPPAVRDYMRLRGINPSRFDFGAPWQRHLWERIAEDGRWWFGSKKAKACTFLPYKPEENFPPPDERIRDWFLSFVKPQVITKPVEIEIVGKVEVRVPTIPEHLFITDFIPKGRQNRPGVFMSPEWITIHDTANTKPTANALNHAKYLKNPNTRDSWHFTVDDYRIIQHLPTSEMAWHAGDGRRGLGNTASIAVEICENAGGDRVKAEMIAAALVADLLKQYKLQPDKIVPHKFWTGKNCPHLLLPRWEEWMAILRGVYNA